MSTGWKSPGATADNPRISHLQINSLTSIKRACLLGIGIAMLPDYIVGRDPGLIQLVDRCRCPVLRHLFLLSGRNEERRKAEGFPRFHRCQGTQLELLTS